MIPRELANIHSFIEVFTYPTPTLGKHAALMSAAMAAATGAEAEVPKKGLKPMENIPTYASEQWKTKNAKGKAIRVSKTWSQ